MIYVDDYLIVCVIDDDATPDLVESSLTTSGDHAEGLVISVKKSL